MRILNILVIEDDKYFRLFLREILNDHGIIQEAKNKEEASKLLKNHVYDLVIADLDLDQKLDGHHLIRDIKKIPSTFCIVISSHESEEIIEKTYHLGADQFFSKENLRQNLSLYIENFVKKKDRSHINFFLQNEFITNDAETLNQLEELSNINWKNQHLLITGPTGSGKSALGKLVHQLTYSAPSPFIHLNCSEITENLLESELFGHEKGAFTGADQKKIGKLKLADGGTLFLDEIATMSLGMQQKLLKAIDEKTYYPVGSKVQEKSNFTLITATCEDLKEKMSEGKFREDFYYRICGFVFDLKPLSDRKGDIALIFKHLQKNNPRKFILKQEAWEILNSYTWPGNIRELKKCFERIVQKPQGIIGENEIKEILGNIASKKTPLLITESQKDLIKSQGLRSFITTIEKEIVQESITRNKGKVTLSIKELQISSSAFYRIVNDHKLIT
jgi:DNA-binding NtrC family response regulator